MYLLRHISDASKTWRSGRATEVMKRLGYFREEREQSNRVENRATNGPPATATRTEAGIRPAPPNTGPREKQKQETESSKSESKAFNFNGRSRRFSPPRVLPNPVVTSKAVLAELPNTASKPSNNVIVHQGLFTQVGPSHVFQTNPGLVPTVQKFVKPDPPPAPNAFNFSKKLPQQHQQPPPNFYPNGNRNVADFEEEPRVQPQPFRTAYEQLVHI
jgi:hypothetical protein